MKKHVAAAVTISAFAYGKILRTNAIIFKKKINLYRVLIVKNHSGPKQLMLT
jgi:hypothetical protein